MQGGGGGLGAVFRRVGLKTQIRLDPFPPNPHISDFFASPHKDFSNFDFSWSILHFSEKSQISPRFLILSKNDIFSQIYFSKFLKNSPKPIFSQKFSKLRFPVNNITGELGGGQQDPFVTPISPPKKTSKSLKKPQKFSKNSQDHFSQKFSKMFLAAVLSIFENF